MHLDRRVRAPWPRLALLIGATASMLANLACNKDEPSLEAGQKYQLTGLSEVQPALARGDYDAVVQALVKAKVAVSTDAEEAEYRRVFHNAAALVGAAQATNEAAKNAIQALRIMQMGR